MNGKYRREKGDYIEYRKYRRRKRKIQIWARTILLTITVGLFTGTIIHLSASSDAKSKGEANASKEVICSINHINKMQEKEKESITDTDSIIIEETKEQGTDKTIGTQEVKEDHTGKEAISKEEKTKEELNEDGIVKEEVKSRKDETKNDTIKQNAKKENAKKVKEPYAVVKGKYADSDLIKEVSVPKSKKVSSEYFADTLFVGNSRTQGLQINTALTKATFYADRGLALDQILTKEFIKEGSKKVTLETALKKRTFKKIYLMFGVNELGWYSSKVFIDRYKGLVQVIQELQPNAKIYVQSCIPVTRKKSDEDDVYTNHKVYEFNELIAQMTKDLNVNYINVAEGVRGNDGALPADASIDGSHLNKKYCEKWLGYLKSHVIY